MVGGLDATAVLPRPLPPEPALTDPWGYRLSAAVLAGPKRGNRWQRMLSWLLPALVTGGLGGLGLTRPALWTDELATWGMAGTPWHRMWPVLRWVDAVLAPYYVLMRGWAELAGTSDLALRVPSLAAMIGAAGLAGGLGTRLGGYRAGLLAGLVFAVLPSTTRFAQEARPYALTAFVAVAATYLLVRAWERPTVARFGAYSIAIVLLGLLHILALLLLVAHAWTAAAWYRRTLPRWALSAAVAVAPLLPLAWLGRQQSGQVAYIPKVGLHSAGPYATVVLGTVGLAIAMAVLGLFSLPLRRPAGLYAAWVVLPAAGLVAASLAVPLFLPRYLILTAPGWALVAGAALARLRWSGAIAALLGVAALGVPAQVGMREVDGHDEATRTVAQIIAANRQPGDVVVYAAAEQRGGWTARDLVTHYVPADRRPADPLLLRPPRTDGQLLAGECPAVPRCLHSPARIWVVRLGEFTDPLAGLGTAKEQVLRPNYRIERVWRPRNLTLALLVRGG